MLIPTGSVRKATATASTIKEVKCAFCHRPYFYVMTRSGSGRDSEPLWIGQPMRRTRPRPTPIGS